MEANIDVTANIRSIPLFFDLDSSQIERVAALSDVIEINPGELLIEEGDHLDFLYILLEGEVKVTILIPTLGSVETSTLGPLDIIGWSAMTPIVRQRTGTVTAITNCLLLRINSKLLASLCDKDHDIGFIVYRRMANVVARSFLSTRIQLMHLISDRNSP